MLRAPICGETNPWYVRTPGPVGCNDAGDPDNPILDSASPQPLGLEFKKGGKAKLKVVGEAEKRKRQPSRADAVANLTKPAAAIVQQLSAAIGAVKKLNQEYETTKKSKDEDLRLKKEKVLKDIVKAYGVGLKYVTGLEFSNTRNDANLAETRGTFIIAFDDILEHPGFVANVILHESSHAQRNAELQSAGLDSNDLGLVDASIWSALKEYEGCQLEIDSAAITGITEKEKQVAINLRDGHLAEIATLLGEKARKEIEQGGLDEVRTSFIRHLKPSKKIK